jgi:hypothetical protein
MCQYSRKFCLRQFFTCTLNFFSPQFLTTDKSICNLLTRAIIVENRKTADVPSNSGSAHFHVSWLFDFIRNPYINRFTNHLTLRKWCYTALQHDFPLDPMISSFHIHFFMVICNSLLLLKSLPINIINYIEFYVNCSALTGPYDWQ